MKHEKKEKIRRGEEEEKENQRSKKQVLIGAFITCTIANAETALKKKGFQVQIAHSEAEFIKALDTADVAMFISGTIPVQAKLTGTMEFYPAWKTATRKQFAEAVIKFHERGKRFCCFVPSSGCSENRDGKNREEKRGIEEIKKKKREKLIDM